MFVKFVKDDKVVQEVSISPEMIPFPTDTVVLEEGKFTVESREYDILDGTCTVILDQQITWTEHPQEYSDAMLAYRKRWNNTIIIPIVLIAAILKNILTHLKSQSHIVSNIAINAATNAMTTVIINAVSISISY